MKKLSYVFYLLLAFRCGYSRRVLLIMNKAVKIARDRNGRGCNIGELHYCINYPNAPIAKVRMCLFNGWVIIMDRCQEIDNNDYDTANKLSSAISEFNMNAEPLPQNIGILKGKLVFVDYWQ